MTLGRIAAPLAVLGVALVNLLAHLGSSSLYLDEGISWQIAVSPLDDIVDRVRDTEISPPGHYFALHSWTLRTGWEDEWALRLPSAVAGVALALATLWLARLVLRDARPALAAGLLAALSPVVLEYGQQARAYAFAALGVTVAAAALVSAQAAGRPRARLAWLALGAVAAIGALWMHYTAGLVLVPLFAWLLLRGTGLALSWRAACAAVVAAGAAPLTPLLVDQLGGGRESGIAAAAKVTPGNVVEVLGALLDGREDVVVLTVVGAAATLAAAVVVARAPADGVRSPLRTLVLPAALAAPLVTIAVSLLGPDVLLSRYVVVGAPFAAVLIAGALAALPRPAALAAGAGVLAAALAGSVIGHLPETRYPDYRTAFARIQARGQSGDGVIVSGFPATAPVAGYYRRAVERDLAVVGEDNPDGIAAVLRTGRPVWLVVVGDLPAAAVAPYLAPAGYRVAARELLEDGAPLTLFLARPA